MLTMTDAGVIEAVAEGRASLLPTTEGRGLTPAEHKRVLDARHEAVRRFAGRNDGPDDTFVFEAVDVAMSVALRVVLAGRPRIEPEPTHPADDDPWAESDTFRWALGPAPDDADHVDPPSSEDERWAAESFGRDPRPAAAYLIDRETAEAVARGGHDA